MKKIILLTGSPNYQITCASQGFSAGEELVPGNVIEVPDALADILIGTGHWRIYTAGGLG